MEEEEKSLQLGKMTNKELAEWFGVKEATFRCTKKDRLKTLAEYAEFTEEKGKVVITKIINPVYKSKKQQEDEILEKRFLKLWNTEIDSCSRVARKIVEEDYENGIITNLSSMERKIRGIREKFFGSPSGKTTGLYGSCRHVYGVREVSIDNLDLFSNDDWSIFVKLICYYFRTTEEKIDKVNFAVADGEISKAEAWDQLMELIKDRDASFDIRYLSKGDRYRCFMHDFKKLTGKTLIRGTKTEVDDNKYIRIGEDQNGN